MRNLVLTFAVFGILSGGLGCAAGGSETPASERFRADAGEDALAGEGDTVTLRASGVNGSGPFVFRWNVERTPEEVDDDGILFDKTAAETTTSGLTVQGRYVFRVVVVDATGRDAYSFVTVNVGPPGTGSTSALEVSIEGPETITPGESGELQVIVDAEGDFTYLWEVVTNHDVTFDAPDEPVTGFVVEEPGSVVVRVTVKDEAAPAAGAAEFTIDAFFEGALAVTVSGPTSVEVNELIEVTASVTNANGEVSFAWTVTDGEADLTNADTNIVSVRPKAAGRLAVEVEVTDDFDGGTATDEYVVTVDPSTAPLTLRAIGPDILLIGEDGALSVEIDTEEEFDEFTYAWEVVQGDAELDDPTAAEPNLTASLSETIEVHVEVTATSTTASRFGEAAVFVVSIAEERPQVVFTIADFGGIVFELRADLTPKTAANLLRYVDDGFYDDTAIHRVAEGFVVQAGGFRLDENGEMEQLEPRDPISSEADTGLSNTNGTVAMALSGGDADSGTSQWFVNLADNSANLDTQNFTAFATVIEGTDVVEAIAAVETELNPNAPSGEESLPTTPIIIESATRRDVPEDDG